MSLCRDHDPTNSSVPLCPEQGSILTDDYPASAITISDGFDFGKSGYGGQISTAAGFERQQAVTEVIAKFLVAQPDRPPQIFLNGSESTKNYVVSELKKRKILPADTIDRLIVRFPDSVGGDSWTWQQDMFQAEFNKQTGRPVLREVAPYYGKVIRRLTRPSLAVMRKVCGAESGPGIVADGHLKAASRAAISREVPAASGSSVLTGSNRSTSNLFANLPVARPNKILSS